jgi:hypothetical protein
MLFTCQFLGWQVGEFTHPVFASLHIPLWAAERAGQRSIAGVSNSVMLKPHNYLLLPYPF